MLDFRKALAQKSFFIFDGAMGTMLQAEGLSPGVSPEAFGLARPEAIVAVHHRYLEAGSQVITTNTFGGTRYKLGSDIDVFSCNRTMVELARQAAGNTAFVAGSIGPTGKLMAPMGTTSFRELVEVFAEQIRGLVAGGVDFVLIETQIDLAEARAAVVAVREVSDLPVAVSMTFEKGQSLTGTTPITFLDTMQNHGVDCIGVNCGAGPEEILPIVKAFAVRVSTPLLVQPNAGLPTLENGRSVFPLGAVDFAQHMLTFARLGVQCLGGCCGVTPDHIRTLVVALAGESFAPSRASEFASLVLTSRFLSVPIGFSQPCTIIGECINPTGKPALAVEFGDGRHGLALTMAEEQLAAGATVLDVNVGAPMVDEAVLLPQVVDALVQRFAVPLSLDSARVKAIELDLLVYPGSALVNSISGESDRLETFGPICKRFGAPFVLLPLKGCKLPVTASERISIIEELLAKVLDLNIPMRLVMVDVLAFAVSSNPEAARVCLDTIRYCKDVLGLPTVFGLSNISFGLPVRELLNSTFLAMAMTAGLTACIANPGSYRLREILAAAEVLLAYDMRAERFIVRYADWRPSTTVSVSRHVATTLREAVIMGDKEYILHLLDQALAGGAEAFTLVDKELIPGIVEVGERYERREYYLPQLLLAAETMQIAFERLKPLLEQAGQARKRPVIILATVEDDIHDIGKNIVGLMLKNHGFEVVDLGKNVPASVIVAAAEEHHATLIGLSALMTTTIVRMEDTVRLVAKKGLPTRVLIGGAVVTQDFATAIGAHGYARDAVAAVRLAQQLLITVEAEAEA
ncbi:5-methyltetrahydrofolate--homocysteine methyltransferase [Desulfovibrionales bacterium]